MKSILKSHLMSLMGGSLYALAYPNELGSGWFPLVFIGLSLFLFQMQKATPKQCIGHVLCYNVGLNFIGYYWIPHTLREFGQLPYAISILLGLAFSLILQPHWWGYVLWKKFRPEWRWHSELGVLTMALLLTLLEQFIPQQFPSYVGSPWLHLAPYLGMAPVFGIAVFSYMTYWVCLEVGAQLSLKHFRSNVWIFFAIFIVMNCFSALKIPEASRNLDVRIVQANIGNFLKVSSESGNQDSLKEILHHYHELSTQKNGFEPELIVWPETAYPNTFYGEASRVDSLFLNIMDTTGAELVIGGYEQDPTKPYNDFIESVFNSSLLLSEGKLKASYHKNILIPFGETLPFGPLNQSIAGLVPAVSLFARGSGTPLMETRDGYRFITPICYELLESQYMRGLLNQWKGNHFILNHTNDSWYGNTAEPFQHLFLSKWRALEFQLPVIRSTNTGISTVIYSDGSESKRLGIGEDGILDVHLSLSQIEPTPYQRYGIFPTLIFILIIASFIWWREKNEIQP